MLFLLPILAGLAPLALAAPTANRVASDYVVAKRAPEQPLTDGYPTYTPEQLGALAQKAGGGLPNSSLPNSVSGFTQDFFAILAHVEGLETFFFRDFAANVSTNVPGYEVPKWIDRDSLLANLDRIQADEEFHHLLAQGGLAKYTKGPIVPCSEYNFPVHDFTSGIEYALQLTSSIYGTIGAGIEGVAKFNDSVLIRPVANTLAEEGTQGGYFRTLLGKLASAGPFETLNSPQMFWSAFSQVAVKESCPDYSRVLVPALPKLTVLDTFEAENKFVRYGIPTADFDASKSYHLAFGNALNTVFTVAAKKVGEQDGLTVLQGAWEYKQHLLNGLTVIALTETAGPFPIFDVVPATHGPVYAIVN